MAWAKTLSPTVDRWGWAPKKSDLVRSPPDPASLVGSHQGGGDLGAGAPVRPRGPIGKILGEGPVDRSVRADVVAEHQLRRGGGALDDRLHQRGCSSGHLA